MYCGISTWNPNAAATVSAWTTLATDTARFLNTRSGSSGVRALACRATKPASRATAATALARVCAEPQP
jgi:hypothetical protein